MNNQQRIKILTSYQDNPMVHSLTCGVNSMHKNLIPIDCGDNEVILKCIECGYTQHIDDEFIKLLREFDKNQRKMMEKYKKMVEESGNEDTSKC